MAEDDGDAPRWTFLTNHAHVLLCIAADPGIRGRDIATRVGITERTAMRTVADLVEAGYLTRKRHGRRNLYEVHSELPLRHPIEQDNQVAELIRLVPPPPVPEGDGDDGDDGDDAEPVD